MLVLHSGMEMENWKWKNGNGKMEMEKWNACVYGLNYIYT